MKELEYTKPPWAPVYLHPGGPVESGGWEIFTPDYDVAAWITRGAPIRKEGDARIMAASAELYEACKAMVEAMDEVVDEWREREIMDAYYMMDEAIKKVQVANDDNEV